MIAALYPGSFDPPTNGHVDIARRSASIFDKLYVAVYDAPPKRLLFDTAERVELSRQAVRDVRNIEVIPYKGLTVHLAREIGARVVVRGLRASSDFEYEFEMAMMNRNIDAGIEVLCMMTRIDYQFLSSSLLKEVCSLGGSINSLVPRHVEEALHAKLRGAAGSGKE